MNKHLSRSSLLLASLFTLSATANANIVISEVAWMGTANSSYDEWIELSNTGASDVSINGWSLDAADGTPSIDLSGTIPAGGHFLLERTDDNSMPDLAADLIYTGALGNSGEALELRDGSGNLVDATASSWAAGDNSSKATMERSDLQGDGTQSGSWSTATEAYSAGYGSPANSSSSGSGEMTSQDFIYDLKFAGGLTASTVIDPDSSPASTTSLPMGLAMLERINSATTSIDFSVYGFREQCAFKDALVSAQNRGVTVRGFVDQESDGSYTYSDDSSCDTEAVIAALGTDSNNSPWVRFDLNTSTGNGYSAIMHNKFFIIDGEWVSLGSTNYSDTGIGGEYNANWNMLIQSSNLAQVYTTEFDEMWVDGLTQTRKTDNTVHVLPTYNDGTVVESYFAPTDDVLNQAIVPAIDSADTTLDVAIFYLTSQDIADAIEAADTRGANVRVILDATAASNTYSKHDQLCDAGIPVKIENWNGKMHMKALLADSDNMIIGSQNFTGAGNDSNDENTLWIKGGAMTNISADYNAYFNAMWNAIPDDFICASPGAESLDSGNTCYDGKDNDYDGYVDGDDFGCQS